jgi:hypothetical protein
LYRETAPHRFHSILGNSLCNIGRFLVILSRVTEKWKHKKPKCELCFGARVALLDVTISQIWLQTWKRREGVL